MNNDTHRETFVTLILGVAILIGAAILHRHRKPRIVLEPYNGTYKGNKHVAYLKNNFNDIINDICKIIEHKASLKPPYASHIIVILDDTLDSHYYFGKTKSINRHQYEIRLNPDSVAHDFGGRSSIKTVLTHEMTHVYMRYNIPDIDSKPRWYKEGLPIYVSGQREELRKAILNHSESADIENIKEYNEIADQFHRHMKLPE